MVGELCVVWLASVRRLDLSIVLFFTVRVFSV